MSPTGTYEMSGSCTGSSSCVYGWTSPPSNPSAGYSLVVPGSSSGLSCAALSSYLQGTFCATPTDSYTLEASCLGGSCIYGWFAGSPIPGSPSEISCIGYPLTEIGCATSSGTFLLGSSGWSEVAGAP
jgi:hypothetical protein